MHRFKSYRYLEGDNMIKYLKSRGFTDRIYLINLILVWIYTIFCGIISIFAQNIGITDFSFITVVCPLLWADLAVHTGFVVWKAKVENLSKWTGNDVAKNANMNINMDI